MVKIDAETFTARRCCSRLNVFNFESETTTAAAAPSQFAEHIGRVFGYAIMTSFMISSSDIFLVYAASGLRVECEWFFSEILAKSSKLVPPYLWPYSIPTCAKTPGMVSVPMRPSTPATAP